MEANYTDYATLIVHGTDKDSLDCILKDGFLCSPSELWAKGKKAKLSSHSGLDFAADGCSKVYLAYVGNSGEGLEMAQTVTKSKGVTLPVYLVFNDGIKDQISAGCRDFLEVSEKISLDNLEAILVPKETDFEAELVSARTKIITIDETNTEKYASACLNTLKQLTGCLPDEERFALYAKKTSALRESIWKDATKKLWSKGRFEEFNQIKNMIKSGNSINDYFYLESTRRYLNSLIN